MLDSASISLVLDALRPERDALLRLLGELDPDDWDRPTECPLYSIKGIATHLIGDDLLLLSRQRDKAPSGLIPLRAALRGADFRTLLDTFNDRWVAAAGFVSIPLLLELLRLCGEWTNSYYASVQPSAEGEPVVFFGTSSGTSPMWQAIAREFIERWVHHSQIRRALRLGSLDDYQFLSPGVEVIATAVGLPIRVPPTEDQPWAIGDLILGSHDEAADVLTRAHCRRDSVSRRSGQSNRPLPRRYSPYLNHKS